MVLNKRYRRNFKSSLPFYISAVVLTAISVWLYMCLASGVTCEKEYLEDFNERCKIEDGNFIVSKPMNESELEDEYNVVLEKNKYVNVETENYTVRIFEPNTKINLYDVIEGEDIKYDNDILISKNFADANKINIGDEMSINNSTFTVKGYCERPDYGTVLENIDDMYYSPEQFGIAIVNDNVLEDCGIVSEYMSVRYNEDNEMNFRKNLYDDYQTISYISSESNRRINVANSVISQYEAATGSILPSMLIFVIVLLAVVLGRRVKNEMKQIGTLTALGYKKREIIFHYCIFAMVPGIIGSIIGVVATILTIKPVAKLIFFKLEKYPVNYVFPIDKGIISLLVPTIAYLIAAIVTVRRLLKADAISLLSGDIKRKKRKTKLFTESRLHFSNKYKLRMLLGNLSRSLVVILGVAIGGVVMLYGFICMDSSYYYKDTQTEKIGTFKYEYILRTINQGEPDYGDIMIGNSFLVEGNNNAVMLCGTDENKYIELKDVKGNEIKLQDDKYYITTLAAELYGVKTGDEFTFVNTVTLDEYDIKIEGVVDNDSQIMILTTRDSACELLDLPKDSYNIVMSDEKIDYKDDEVSSIITKESLKDQMQTSIDGMATMMNILIAFGCLLCVICVYLMVNMLVQENISTISMLKVLGYTDKKINKLVVNIYHILIPIGTALGFGLGYYVCVMYFKMSIADFQLKIITHIKLQTVIYYLLCVIGSYALSLYLLKKKVFKVNMIESLKDNRE
ncbi:ABC transporter permease [Clostridium paraputrificum]|uniref:ABC transporter permease n=1 Tax=Clostridium paraputrificum TaxID=29363 RepID=UPI003D33E57C